MAVPGTCCCRSIDTGPEAPDPDIEDCWSVPDELNCRGMIGCYFEPGESTTCPALTAINQVMITPFGDSPQITAAAGAVHDSMLDLRDLPRVTPLGQRVLAYGDQFTPLVVDLTADQPDLRLRLFQTLMKALSFGRAMEKEWLRHGSTSAEHRFSRDDFEYGSAAAEDLRALSNGSALSDAIDELQRQAERFVDLGPAEALEVFYADPNA